MCYDDRNYVGFSFVKVYLYMIIKLRKICFYIKICYSI